MGRHSKNTLQAIIPLGSNTLGILETDMTGNGTSEDELLQLGKDSLGKALAPMYANRRTDAVVYATQPVG